MKFLLIAFLFRDLREIENPKNYSEESADIQTVHQDQDQIFEQQDLDKESENEQEFPKVEVNEDITRYS